MLRGRLHLCDFMPRSKDARRLDADPANEPDFYSITEIFPLDNPSVATSSSAVAPPIPTDLEDSKPRGRKSKRKQVSNPPPEQQRPSPPHQQRQPPPRQQKQAPEDAKRASAPQVISLPVAPPAANPVSVAAPRPPNFAQGKAGASFAARSLSAGAVPASTPQQASFINMPLHLQTHPQPAQATLLPNPGCQPAPTSQPTLANQASPETSLALLLSLVTALQNPQQSALNIEGNSTAYQAPNRSVAPPPPPPPNPPANAAPDGTVLQVLLAILPSLVASQPAPQVDIASSIANLLIAAATERAAPPPPPAPPAAAPSSSGGTLDLFGIMSALISANSQGNENILANVIRLLQNVGQGQDTSTLAAVLALVLIQQNNNNPSGSAPSSS